MEHCFWKIIACERCTVWHSTLEEEQLLKEALLKFRRNDTWKGSIVRALRLEQLGRKTIFPKGGNITQPPAENHEERISYILRENNFLVEKTHFAIYGMLQYRCTHQ